MKFAENMIFEGFYPPEAAIWCNHNDCCINEISTNPTIWQIQKNKHSNFEILENRLMELENYLSETDWYSIRFAETGMQMPFDIKNARQSAREEISNLRIEIATIKDNNAVTEPSSDELLENDKNQQEEQK